MKKITSLALSLALLTLWTPSIDATTQGGAKAPAPMVSSQRKPAAKGGGEEGKARKERERSPEGEREDEGLPKEYHRARELTDGCLALGRDLQDASAAAHRGGGGGAAGARVVRR